MGDRRRVLILAPFPPRLDGRHGGSRSIAHLVLHLAKRNRVALAFLRTEDEEPVDPEVAAACDLVHEETRPGSSHSSVRPWPRALAVLPELVAGKPLWVAARWHEPFARRMRLLSAEWQPHIVQAAYGAMGQYLRFAASEGARSVLNVYEPGAATSMERSREGGMTARLAWAMSARLWARYERSLLGATDATVVLTDRDRREMQALSPQARIVRIPLGISVPAVAADPVGAEPPTLLFVGNYLHPPNLAAAHRLAGELFPPLRSRFPGLRLWIVGDNPPHSLRRYGGDGIEVTGRVPDVGAYLDRAAVFVAPLTTGGGMRVKVLEAMAAGKAVVASPIAAEGLEVESGEHLLVARTDADFVGSVEVLLGDPDLRTRLGGAARRWVAENLSWDQRAAEYEALYDSLSETPQPLSRATPGLA